jgi:hypothetical protein
MDTNALDDVLWPVTQQWVDAAKARLEENGHNAAWLARELGVEQSQISRVFGELGRSRLVPRIAQLLAMHAPFAIIHSVEEQRWLEAGRLILKYDPDGLALLPTYEAWGRAARDMAEAKGAIRK